MTIVRPVLKQLHSPDVWDLESYVPVDPRKFGLLLQAMFGPEGEKGEESFDMMVCSPQWLAQDVEQQGIVVGRHILIVHAFDFAQIRAFLVDYARQCTGQTWREVAEKLARIGKWEFEDYRPFAP